jgi:hypothetical protein
MPTTSETHIGKATRARFRVKWHHAVIGGLALLAGGFGIARWLGAPSEAAPRLPAMAASLESASPPAEATAESPAEPVVANDPSPAELRKQKLLGSWRDDYYGERTMTFHADGTGTMLIKLGDPVSRALYGEKLLFNLSWEDRDGVLVMQFTGGEPKNAVATLSKIFGERHEQRIELLTDSELHLRSLESGNFYTLKRVKDADPDA